MTFNPKVFGQKLRQLREENRLTQDEVAKAASVHKTHVSAWENGRSRPSLDSVIGISHLFQVSIDYLIHDNIPREGIEAINDMELYKEFRETENLGPDDKKLIRDVIQSILFKLKVKDMAITDSSAQANKRTATVPLRKVAGRR